MAEHFLPLFIFYLKQKQFLVMKTQKIINQALMVLFVSLSSFVSLYAQTEIGLFSVVKMSSEQLNREQSRRYSLISTDVLTQNASFVTMAGALELSNARLLRVTVPEESVSYQFVATPKETLSSEVLWQGNLPETSRIDGSLSLIAAEGEVYGQFSIGESTYTLNDLTGGLFLLVKLNNSVMISEKSPLVVDPSEITPSASSAVACTINIMVLYTAKAKLASSNINSLITTAISQMNTAFLNSKITSKVNLIYKVQTEFTEKSNIDNTLSALIADSGIKALRIQKKADIVVLLTNGSFGLDYGIAPLGPSKPYAYAVVQVGQATSGRYTFTHEVGHTLGADHEDGSGYAKGYKFISGTERRTIMHTLGSGSRIQHFSNPNVKYPNTTSGVATGVVNSKDNAKVIANNACTVAGFY